jgi:urease accessory protein
LHGCGGAWLCFSSLNRTAFPIGLTLVEDLLIARCLAPAVEPASRIFRSLWGILRPRLMGRDACPPRIWLT